MSKYYTPKLEDLFVDYKTERITLTGFELKGYGVNSSYYLSDKMRSKPHIITQEDIDELKQLDWYGNPPSLLCIYGTPIN